MLNFYPEIYIIFPFFIFTLLFAEIYINYIISCMNTENIFTSKRYFASYILGQVKKNIICI